MVGMQVQTLWRQLLDGLQPVVGDQQTITWSTWIHAGIPYNPNRPTYILLSNRQDIVILIGRQVQFFLVKMWTLTTHCVFQGRMAGLLPRGSSSVGSVTRAMSTRTACSITCAHTRRSSRVASVTRCFLPSLILKTICAVLTQCPYWIKELSENYKNSVKKLW